MLSKIRNDKILPKLLRSQLFSKRSNYPSTKLNNCIYFIVFFFFLFLKLFSGITCVFCSSARIYRTKTLKRKSEDRIILYSIDISSLVSLIVLPFMVTHITLVLFLFFESSITQIKWLIFHLFLSSPLHP